MRKKEEERRKKETGPIPQSHAQELFVIRERGNPLTPTIPSIKFSYNEDIEF